MQELAWIVPSQQVEVVERFAEREQNSDDIEGMDGAEALIAGVIIRFLQMDRVNVNQRMPHVDNNAGSEGNVGVDIEGCINAAVVNEWAMIEYLIENRGIIALQCA